MFYTTAHFRESAHAEFDRLWQSDVSGAGRDRERGERWLNIYFYEPYRIGTETPTPEQFARSAYDAALDDSWNDR